MSMAERREVWLIHTQNCCSSRPGISPIISDTRYMTSASAIKLPHKEPHNKNGSHQHKILARFQCARAYLCPTAVSASAIPHICATCKLVYQHVLLAHMQTTSVPHMCSLHTCILLQCCIHTGITFNDIHLSINPMYLNVTVLEGQSYSFYTKDLFQELILSFHVCCTHKN